VVALPVALLFVRAFGEGLGAAWASLTTPAALHALKLTVYMVVIAVP
jgi:sulfate transport system permease protein